MKKVLIKGGKPVVADLPAMGAASALELKVSVLSSAVSAGTESSVLVSGASAVYRNRHLLPKAVRFARERGVSAFLKKFQERFAQGMAVGYSAAGVVEAVGPGVQGFAPGDLVACAGAQFAHHAEEILASSRLSVKIPAGVTLEEASTSTLGAIAVEGVRKLQVELGETIVILGMGALGQLAAQIAGASGARVIGLDRDEARVRFALERGWIWQGLAADAQAVKKIQDWTSGAGADAVLIAAHAPGSTEPADLAAKLCRRRGRITVLGNVAVAVARDIFYEKDLSLNIAMSYGPGRYDPVYEERGADYPLPFVRWTAARNMACYLDLIARKKIEISPLIQAVYPIDQAEKAYENLGKGNGPILTLLSYGSPNGDKPAREIPAPEIKKRTGKIRVGVIGAGGFTTSVHLPVLAGLGDTFEIASICNKRPEKAQSIAAQYKARASGDWLSVVNDPNIDLVLIATRHNLHAQIAETAIRQGKAVFVEKPLALNAQELSQLEAAYLEHPVPFQVGFNRRFSGLAAEMKKRLHQMPKPWMLQYRVVTQAVEPGHWVLDAQEGGGRIIGEACHMADLIGFLLRPEAEAGKPWLPQQTELQAAASGSGHPTENFTALLTYPDGAVAALTYSSTRAKEVDKERIEVVTPAGTLFLDDFRSLRIALEGGTQTIARGSQDKGFKEEWLAFARHFQGREPKPPLGFEEAAAVTSLTFLMDELARG